MIHNIEAEQGLIGSLLINKHVMERVIDIVKPEHFSHPLHAEIFRHLLNAYITGAHEDPITLHGRLKDFPGAEAMGGAGAYLTDLMTNVVTVVNAPDYAKVIRSNWLRRTLSDGCNQIIGESAIEHDELTDEARLEHVEQILLEIRSGKENGREPLTFERASEEALQAIERRIKGLDKPLSTGFIAIDEILGGMIPGGLYILAARPAMGKTALMMSMAWRAVSSEKRVLVNSLEMTSNQLIERLLASQTGIHPKNANQSDFMAYHEFRLKRRPLWIDDSGALTVPQIRARAMRLKRMKGLDLICIDYLGLIKAIDNRANRVHQIEQITSGLKALAKELELPVLLLCQLNRSVEARDDKRPSLSDLRDSGAIEQDADAVMMLYRDEYYLGSPPKEGSMEDFDYKKAYKKWLDQTLAAKGRAEVIVAKNRHGATGTSHIKFDAENTWFRED